MRRGAFKLLRTLSTLLVCSLAAPLFAESGRVTVVYTSEAGAYTEALDGLRGSLGNTVLAAVDLRSPNAEAELASSISGNRLVITVGKEALERVSARSLAVPLVATMIMRSEQDRVHKISAAVHLDIPITDVLARLKPMFPHKTRVAIIRNPSQPGQADDAAVARGRQQGFAARVVDANNPDQLLRVVRSLNGQVDFIVCLPDSSLYNSATVKPLILASLESHLLIVGFSASFVRAGAGVGVYADFRDIGAQAGEIAQRQLAGQSITAEQGPRKLVVAVNQRVLRLLGLEYQPRREGEVVIFR